MPEAHGAWAVNTPQMLQLERRNSTTSEHSVGFDESCWVYVAGGRHYAQQLLTSISRIIVPGASRTTKPTNIPARMATKVS